jgi:hypothetical protein
MSQQISIGRIVFYHQTLSQGSEELQPIPAIVTNVRADGKAQLVVFHPEGSFSIDHVTESKKPEAGYWTWPPR